MIEQKKNKLDELVQGDIVVIRSYGGWGRIPYRFKKVTKVTKTQIVCGDSRYRKESGYEVGSDVWGRDCIHIPTEDDYIGNRVYLAQNKLLKVEVTKDNLTLVEALLDKLNKPKEITNESN